VCYFIEIAHIIYGFGSIIEKFAIANRDLFSLLDMDGSILQNIDPSTSALEQMRTIILPKSHTLDI